MSGFEDLDDEALEFLILTLETQDEIIERRRAGESHEAIAEAVGWSLETVRVFLETNEFSPDYKGKLRK